MTIEEYIGKNVFDMLMAAALDPVLAETTANEVIQYCNRDKALIPFRRINLLISMIRSAIRSPKVHEAQWTGNAEVLIKSLNLNEETRIQLYEALFDKGLLCKAGGIVIYRR